MEFWHFFAYDILQKSKKFGFDNNGGNPMMNGGMMHNGGGFQQNGMNGFNPMTHNGQPALL